MTLAQIQTAVEALSSAEKQDLLLFLAARLRAQSGPVPPARKFSRAQLNAWIADDEAQANRFRDRSLADRADQPPPS